MKRLKKSNYDDEIKQIDYELNQSFNPLISFLHSIRYKHLLNLFAQLSTKYPNRTLRVVEIGSAHAKTFALLNDRFSISYVSVRCWPGVQIAVDS
jgi:hypothetical protein